jgi:hypothetical protein
VLRFSAGPSDAQRVRILPLLGSTLGLAAVLGGGLVLRPDLLAEHAGAPDPATEKAAKATTGSAADRAKVVAGTNPVNGATGWIFDRSTLGLPVVPNAPSVQLPELQLSAPGPGRSGSITTRTRSQQFGHTATWQAQPQVDGPERRLVRTAPENGYVVVPTEPGDLHLLCGETAEDRSGAGSYYVDSHEGEWRVYRVDGGPNYDVQYRFVQYDRSPLAARTACQ